MHQAGGDLQRLAGKADPRHRFERVTILPADPVEIAARGFRQGHHLGIKAIDQLALERTMIGRMQHSCFARTMRN